MSIELNEGQMKELEDRIINGLMGRIGERLSMIAENLVKNMAIKDKLGKDFYAKYPQFDQHRDVVAKVVSSLEGQDLTKGYEEILREAVPIVEQTLKGKKELDFKSIKSQPKTKIDVMNGINGEL